MSAVRATRSPVDVFPGRDASVFPCPFPLLGAGAWAFLYDLNGDAVRGVLAVWIIRVPPAEESLSGLPRCVCEVGVFSSPGVKSRFCPGYVENGWWELFLGALVWRCMGWWRMRKVVHFGGDR